MNIVEIAQKYPDELSAIQYFEKIRWKNKPVCPYCKSADIIDAIIIDHSKLYSYRGINSNTIESFWSIIKRQIMGQHHHVSPKYLSKYVAEAVFHFNNRKDDDMFETLVKFSMYKKD